MTRKRSLYIFGLHVHTLTKAYLGRQTLLQFDRQLSLQITARHKMTRFVNLKYQPYYV